MVTADDPVTLGLDAGGTMVGGARYPASAAERRNVTVLLAHGAGAGHRHRFMVTFARGLADRGCEVVTFNFPYMERGRRVPDPGPVLEACYCAVVRQVGGWERPAPTRLVIGGKSMGGRIASQILAGPGGDLEAVAGLLLLGYPLHPPGRPGELRVKHLAGVRVSSLFVQGTRDSFGSPSELEPFVNGMAAATIRPVEGGDHSFSVPRGSRLRQGDLYDEIHDDIVRWIDAEILA